MKYKLNILRRAHDSQTAYWQRFIYETDSAAETIAAALKNLNESERLTDETGKEAREIGWECNCLQKKCGACAMVINGIPSLACDKRLFDLGENIKLEPLKKFPVIEDLIVDRSVMFENLRQIRLWFDNYAAETKKSEDTAYEASRCLQCGCCLEVCPNFFAGGQFMGMAAAVPMTRLISQMPKEQRVEMSKLYTKHVYNGCGKSLACRNICPAGIDIEKILVNSNAAAVWKRFFKA